jgi:hypothetical protein
MQNADGSNRLDLPFQICHLKFSICICLLCASVPPWFSYPYKRAARTNGREKVRASGLGRGRGVRGVDEKLRGRQGFRPRRRSGKLRRQAGIARTIVTHPARTSLPVFPGVGHAFRCVTELEWKAWFRHAQGCVTYAWFPRTYVEALPRANSAQPGGRPRPRTALASMVSRFPGAWEA